MRVKKASVIAAVTSEFVRVERGHFDVRDRIRRAVQRQAPDLSPNFKWSRLEKASGARTCEGNFSSNVERLSSLTRGLRAYAIVQAGSRNRHSPVHSLL